MSQIICDMQTLGEVIDAFGYAELAAILGKPPGTVSSWKSRNQLPSEFWKTVLEAAARRGMTDITADLLIRLDANRACSTNNKALGKSTLHSAVRASR
ncbi:ribbon-helix-helix domain-containing protein [Methylobacterium gossipiicola]|uniref:ribbon-helix-helix domain-containing protein n=1 Tax=Methylobacterium gossipiicola TaxID=582675 RepID=UPI001160D61A|nr:ribbon-helix-helix domain-containing protein [Methylobacterium gossipiicola]